MARLAKPQPRPGALLLAPGAGVEPRPPDVGGHRGAGGAAAGGPHGLPVPQGRSPGAGPGAGAARRRCATRPPPSSPRPASGPTASCSAAARWAAACARWRSPTACRPPGLVLLVVPAAPAGQARQAPHRAPAGASPCRCSCVSGTKDPFGTPGRARAPPRRHRRGRSPTCGSTAPATSGRAATSRSPRSSPAG